MGLPVRPVLELTAIASHLDKFSHLDGAGSVEWLIGEPGGLVIGPAEDQLKITACSIVGKVMSGNGGCGKGSIIGHHWGRR